ncbi:MAG: alpha/beta hydrolase [SAR324 cluster bacterium]|nr:alpha/beta hydrolase [SAR324 cluster bacterium]
MKRTLLIFWCALILPGCNYLFYYPSKHVFSTPDQYQLFHESVEFESSDGTLLTGWFIPAINPNHAKGTIIQFHGNAENMTSHYRSLVWLPYQQYNLFAFDYRGFGQSAGEPDLHGPVLDSVAAIEYVRKRNDVDPKKIILIGQSIGGALAIAAAANTPKEGIQAIVIESTFSSYQRITRDKLGDVAITWPLQWPLSLIFIRDVYSPEELVSQLAPVPLLFIHGTNDRIVPYYHGTILHQAAKPPKFFWSIDGGQHTEAFTVYGRIYQKKLLAFLEGLTY